MSDSRSIMSGEIGQEAPAVSISARSSFAVSFKLSIRCSATWASRRKVSRASANARSWNNVSSDTSFRTRSSHICVASVKACRRRRSTDPATTDTPTIKTTTLLPILLIHPILSAQVLSVAVLLEANRLLPEGCPDEEPPAPGYCRRPVRDQSVGERPQHEVGTV